MPPSNARPSEHSVRLTKGLGGISYLEDQNNEVSRPPLRICLKPSNPDLKTHLNNQQLVVWVIIFYVTSSIRNILPLHRLHFQTKKIDNKLTIIMHITYAVLELSGINI